MPYNKSEEEKADIDSQGYLDKILNYFRPSPLMFDSPINAEPLWMQELRANDSNPARLQELRANDSNPARLQELRANDKIYGNSEDFNPKSGEILSNIVSPAPAPAPAMQPQAPVIPQQPARDTLMRFQSRNINPPKEEASPVMAPVPVPVPISPIETKAASAQEVSQAPVEAQKPDESIFNSISNTLKDVSKSASDTFNDPAFRQGLGGILVAIGAGFQGQDASKSLERYHNSILNDKQEARRKALEEEQRVKKDPNSVWNLTYREMIKKSLPGVDKLMGPSFDNMTEEMLRQNYPMISSSMTKMTEKELSNPGSASSIDAVKSYNEMISSFGGKIKLLEEGKYSAKDVDKFMSNVNNVIQYNHQEDQKDFNKSKLSEDIRQFNERQKQEQAFKKEDLGIKKAQLSAEIEDQNRRYGLEVNKFKESIRRSNEAAARANKLMEMKASGTGGVFSEKEKAKIAMNYPMGIVLDGNEKSKLSKMGSAYVKMEQSLNHLQTTINKYGAPVNPNADGYSEVNSAWGNYMTALKDAEEMGALDKGVEGAAKKVLPNPTDVNMMIRTFGGESKVKQVTTDILNSMKNKYKSNYASNTAMYGYNPSIGAGRNNKMMDEFINPDTSEERRKQIIKEYSKYGYSTELFGVYADNYETRRKPVLGVQ